MLMESKEKSGKWPHIIITQAITVSIILISVLVIKYLSKATFLKLKDWYTEHLCNHTHISEVLEKAGDSGEI